MASPSPQPPQPPQPTPQPQQPTQPPQPTRATIQPAQVEQLYEGLPLQSRRELGEWAARSSALAASPLLVPKAEGSAGRPYSWRVRSCDTGRYGAFRWPGVVVTSVPPHTNTDSLFRMAGQLLQVVANSARKTRALCCV